MQRKAQPVVSETRPERLSPERILTAALGVVEREGLDALSMRRLAEELDVWPMAVYRYYRDKDELLDAMVDAASGGVPLPDGSRSWREQLLELLTATRSALGRYAGGVDIPVGRALLSPSGLRMSEAGVRALIAAGLEPGEAARAWRALFAYAVGMPPLAGADPGKVAREARVALAALSPEEYPSLAAVGDALAGAAEDQSEFEYGLERLLDGLEARTRAKT